MKLNKLIQTAVKRVIAEQEDTTSKKNEFDNAPSSRKNNKFTPAEKKFLGKFDAYGSTHLGIIYSISDIGIREFMGRSGADLNITPDILIGLLRRGYIKIVPYGGFGSDDNYTIELQLSLDDVKGWGAEEQEAAENKPDASGAGTETDMAGPSISTGVPPSSEEPTEPEEPIETPEE